MGGGGRKWERGRHVYVSKGEKVGGCGKDGAAVLSRNQISSTASQPRRERRGGGEPGGKDPKRGRRWQASSTTNCADGVGNRKAAKTSN